ncbi:hypothetical protein [Shimazuella kribbensis]|uniref:hypothetical protein n=1 Tax=Shimazuella kribbensis TaxID=139808 RepID=UPI00048F2C3A|nr:hypothetical protein [Shimazuella kribbensis]
MFLLSIMSFFIFAISGVQLVSGGYLLAGIPALVVSGVVPVLSSLWSSQQSYSSDDSWNDGSKDDGCCDIGGCGCGPCWYVKE